ncbi:MAG: ferrochelatase [Oligoflexia bacterium]|nr:ferrochelatase [Oligoflexia bacterium]
MRFDIILVQLGSPQNASYFEIRRYLRDFLISDRVVKREGVFHNVLWIIVLYFFILTLRPFKLRTIYKKLSDKFNGEMPLIKNFNLFVEKLCKRIAIDNKDDKNNSINIHGAYILSSPRISDVIKKIKGQQNKFDKVYLIPHYPLYSEPTNALIFDEFSKHAKELNLNLDFDFRFIGSYHLAQFYVEQTSKLIDENINNWKKEEVIVDYLILSYHGMPLKISSYTLDNYLLAIEESFSLIKEKITSLDKKVIYYAFQSKFGYSEWTKPYLENLIDDICDKHRKNKNKNKNKNDNNNNDSNVVRIAIATPGFLIDCLETLHELANQLKSRFAKKGIELYVISCLNYRDDWVDSYVKFLLSNLRECQKITIP